MSYSLEYSPGSTHVGSSHLKVRVAGSLLPFSPWQHLFCLMLLPWKADAQCFSHTPLDSILRRAHSLLYRCGSLVYQSLRRQRPQLLQDRYIVEKGIAMRISTEGSSSRNAKFKNEAFTNRGNRYGANPVQEPSNPGTFPLPLLKLSPPGGEKTHPVNYHATLVGCVAGGGIHHPRTHNRLSEIHHHIINQPRKHNARGLEIPRQQTVS